MKTDLKLSNKMQEYCEGVVSQLCQELSIKRELEVPEVIVYVGTHLPGEDSDSWATYDPAENCILIAHDKNATSYEEYDRFAKSQLIGTIDKCTPIQRTKYLLLHELAHWMTDYVLKNYTHKHSITFKLCYAYLRAMCKP